MNEAYIGIGSNLGNRLENCKKALKLLENLGGKVKAVSSPYLTSPYGPKNQPWFVNCVCSIDTTKSPEELLEVCKSIERELGRKATEKWGPRVVDLDILLYEDFIIKKDTLKIPHYDMKNRLFFLIPLLEINGEIKNPETGKPIKDTLAFGSFRNQVVIRIKWQGGAQWKK